MKPTKLLHVEVGTAALCGDASFLAGDFDGLRKLGADWVGEGDVGNDAVAEEGVDAMASSIEELVGDYEVEWLVLFLERADRGDGDDAVDAELLESVDIGAEVEFGGQEAVARAVTREEGDLAAFEGTEYVGIGGIAERSLLADFVDVGEPGHGETVHRNGHTISEVTIRAPVEFGGLNGSACSLQNAQSLGDDVAPDTVPWKDGNAFFSGHGGKGITLQAWIFAQVSGPVVTSKLRYNRIEGMPTTLEKAFGGRAHMGQYAGVATPAHFGDVRAEYDALRHSAAIFDLNWRAKLALTGGDRVRWLNGMVTNNIRDLAAGCGVYAFLLNPQGKILGDMLYALVLANVMRDLGISKATSGFLYTLTLLASGIGGVLFGFVADRIGRKRALMLSILTYSVCSFASGLARSALSLAVFRFVLGLGMGGEWNTGATLVAETWPTELRAKAISIVQSSWAIGYAFAALVAGVVLHYASWRYVFFVGILPAGIIFWIQSSVPESEMWKERGERGRGAKNARVPSHVSFGAIFRQPFVRSTMALLFANFFGMFAWWGLFTWLPPYLSLPVEHVVDEMPPAVRGGVRAVDVHLPERGTATLPFDVSGMMPIPSP